MDLRTARYLVAVAEHGSLSKAARVLFLAQPALSRSMRNLERELGVALFDRSGPRLELTRAGRLAVASARRMLAELDRARHRVSAVTSLAAGRLYVSTTSLLAVEPLARIAGQLHRLHPGVQLHVVHGGSSAGVVDDIRRGVAELGLGELTQTPDSIHAEPLLEGALVYAAHPDIAAGIPDPVPAALVASSPLVVETVEHMTFAAVERMAAAAPETAVVRCAHAEGVWALVRQGAGATLLPREVAARVLPDMVIRAVEPSPTFTVAAVKRPGPVSPAAAAFCEIAAATVT